MGGGDSSLEECGTVCPSAAPTEVRRLGLLAS
jgi:hypothetical protein